MNNFRLSILTITFFVVTAVIALSLQPTEAQVNREDTRVMAQSDQPEQPQDISTMPIPQAAQATGAFSILSEVMRQTGLDQPLSQFGPFTVFAPLDGAFIKLPQETIDSMQNDPQKMTDILRYHVVEGRIASEDLVKLDTLTTIDGKTLKIRKDEGGLKVNDATILTTDVETSNGLIHAIDTVLFP